MLYQKLQIFFRVTCVTKVTLVTKVTFVTKVTGVTPVTVLLCYFVIANKKRGGILSDTPSSL